MVIFTKKWWEATGNRCIRTFAEAALSYIGTGALLLNDVNWLGVISAGTMGVIIAFFLALAGLPEVKQD